MAHLPKAASEGDVADKSAAIAMEKARMYILQNQSVNDMNTYIIQYIQTIPSSRLLSQPVFFSVSTAERSKLCAPVASKLLYQSNLSTEEGRRNLG